MAFLDKMGKIAKTVGEKTGDAVEIGRINLKINQVEGKIKDAKQELGSLMYLLYRNGRTLPEDAALICQQIRALEETIAQLEADKAAVTADREEPDWELAEPVAVEPETPAGTAGEQVCPECGSHEEAGAKFCGNCGHPFA